MKRLCSIQTIIIITLIIITFNSCSKKSTPKPQPLPAITLGSYAIIKDQGSANGDTVYYSRTIAPCEAAARYTFTANTITLTSPCTTPMTATWTFDPTSSIMTITDSSNNTGKIKIENLTPTGFIYDEIATSQDNLRLTLQLSN